MPIVRPLKAGIHPFDRVTIGCDHVPNIKQPDGPHGEIISVEAAGRSVVIQLTPGGKNAKVTVDGIVIR